MDGATAIERIHLRSFVFICLYLRLKKDNLLTADNKGLTLIHAEVEKRDRNNSDAYSFDIKPLVACHVRLIPNPA